MNRFRFVNFLLIVAAPLVVLKLFGIITSWWAVSIVPFVTFGAVFIIAARTDDDEYDDLTVAKEKCDCEHSIMSWDPERRCNRPFCSFYKVWLEFDRGLKAGMDADKPIRPLICFENGRPGGPFQEAA